MHVPLGKIADIKLGKMLDRAKNQSGKRLRYLRNINVRWGSIETDDVLEMYFDDDESDRFGLRAGDVLVCEGGEPGRAAVWDGREPTIKYQKALHRVRFREPFEPRFLVYLLEHLAKSGALERRFTGSTIKHFTRESFTQLPIPLRPLEEQKYIVAEIEKQFTQLDAGVTSLKRVQAALKRYRASVLKAACEGRLVPTEAELARSEGRSYENAAALLARVLEERRAKRDGRGKFKEPLDLPSSRHEADALPEGWTWGRLEQLALIFGGLTKNPKRAKLPKQLPYLRVANVYSNKLRLDEIERIGVEDSELEKLLVRTGDLLIVEGNGSKDQIGRLAIWDGSIDPCVHQNHLIKVRAIEPSTSRWFLHWLQSPRGRELIQLVASSTSGLYTLSVNKVGDLSIALPPLVEQRRIIAEVERRLSVVEELESVVASNLQRAAGLRQSILQRAFSGRLVSTDLALVTPPLLSEEREPMLALEFTETSRPEPRWEEPMAKHWGRARIFEFAEQEALRVGYRPGADLRQILYREGGRVIFGNAETLGDTGMIIVRGPKKFAVTLSPKSGRQRQQFTLAHELGHYVLHADRGKHAIKICRKGTGLLESEAHWFASAFLIPENLLRKKMREGLNPTQLADFFGVSLQVVEIRRKELHE